jgi:hypothetical protein
MHLTDDIAQLLKRNRHHWSWFELVEAYRERVLRQPEADFNELLEEFGLPGSEQYAAAHGHRLVVWHATRRRHVDKILAHGLFHHAGVFFAPPSFGLPFKLAGGIPRREKSVPDQLAVLTCVFDTHEYPPGRAFERRASEIRFKLRITADAVYAVVTDEEVRCVGPRVVSHDTPVRGVFVRQAREWCLEARNPCYFGPGLQFRTAPEWLDCMLTYLFRRHRELSLYEVLCLVGLNYEPRRALSDAEILAAAARRCEARTVTRRKIGKAVLLWEKGL